jgi:hypothetical protein
VNGIVSHIYREGNQVADALANGCSLSSFTSWEEVPTFITDSFRKHQLGSPNFRVCTS